MVTRKTEDGQETLFPSIVRGPLGCHLPSSLVPKSKFRGSRKSFSEMRNGVQKDAEFPKHAKHTGVLSKEHRILYSSLSQVELYYHLIMFGVVAGIIMPWILSTHRFGLNPYLELIYQFFKSHIFALLGAYLVPLGPKKAAIIVVVKAWRNAPYQEAQTTGLPCGLGQSSSPGFLPLARASSRGDEWNDFLKIFRLFFSKQNQGFFKKPLLPRDWA